MNPIKYLIYPFQSTVQLHFHLRSVMIGHWTVNIGGCLHCLTTSIKDNCKGVSKSKPSQK